MYLGNSIVWLITKDSDVVFRFIGLGVLVSWCVHGLWNRCAEESYYMYISTFRIHRPGTTVQCLCLDGRERNNTVRRDISHPWEYCIGSTTKFQTQGSWRPICKLGTLFVFSIGKNTHWLGRVRRCLPIQRIVSVKFRSRVKLYEGHADSLLTKAPPRTILQDRSMQSVKRVRRALCSHQLYVRVLNPLI